jgi:hypothetical protein
MERVMARGCDARPTPRVDEVAFPGDVDEFDAFVEDVLGDDASGCCSLIKEKTMTAANATSADSTTNCAWGSVQISTLGVEVAASMDDGDADESYAEVRVVESPGARVGKTTVSQWARYIQSVHATWTGENAGWDRWLDNHVGIEVGGSATGGALDRYVPRLERHNVSFRAKMGGAAHGSWNATEGSLWTGGSGGQGVELHGDFDWSVLVANETVGMKYCASPAVAGASARGAQEDAADRK